MSSQNNSFYADLKGIEIIIDRKVENEDVATYQRTKDEEVLTRIFKNRIPTLKYWAVQHYFPGLALSIEDFYGELVIVFVKALEHYKYGRGSFNTCLYTFLLNRIKNIKAGKYAKKRLPEFYEGTLSGIMLSLDYAVEEGGKSITLQDKLESEESVDFQHNQNEVHFNESVNILSEGNVKLKEIFFKLGRGSSVSSLLKECKTKHGEIELDNELCNEYEKTKCKSIIVNKIKEKYQTDKFKLLDYRVECNILSYQIEMKKTQESELLTKTIKNLKDNKERYMKMIRGECINSNIDLIENI